MATHKVKLEVLKIAEEDIYKDFVRIPQEHRGQIAEGRVCELRVGHECIRRAVRGYLHDASAAIRMDEFTRSRLRLTPGKPVEFVIREVGWIGQFLWAWNASDPVPRIAARLGILSVVLGAVGLVLGIIALWK